MPSPPRCVCVQGGGALPAIAELAATTGQGVSGLLNGVAHRVGRPSFVAELAGSPVPEALREDERSGRTVIALGSAQGWLAGFTLSDGLREDCPAAFESLRGKGIALSIFSGDTPSTVEALGRRLGVAQALGGMTPEDKHRGLVALQKGDAVIAMVGDGVNDAPVLAQAQVSVAMGGGTDLARNQADIVLLSGHLSSLAEGVTLSRRALAIIRQNLWWSFAYNFTAVPLAMFGLVTPWMAGIGMSASSLFVVLNALRLQRRPPR
jgi:Cu2+-exporting ATPase